MTWCVEPGRVAAPHRRPANLHLHRDLLAAGEQVGFGKRVLMRHLDVLHAGMKAMQPFTRLAGVKASHTVVTSGELRPQ